MATLSFDCADQANFNGVCTVISDSVSGLQTALLTFTPTGTYDQAASESIELLNVDEGIEDSRRNGKTVTLVDAVGAQASPLFSTPGTKHVPTAALVTGNDVHCTLFVLGGVEVADGALPTYQQPMGILVTFTEA